MIYVQVDDFEIETRPNVSIIETCKLVGINIPRFCYHELLSISGNCRMCLVEVENLEKPVASCVTEVEDGMSILSNSVFVQKARENVVEALLLNHPLDCPICDQAGECDLQDQVKTYGNNYSRYFFKKTSVENKYCGPLIKTVMTRCISCTRCVRYTSEIAGMDFYGTLNRGVNTEIGSYVPKFFKSEISGNVVDLCPVGALTSFPYASKARPWELKIAESIDVTDSLNSNTYVNFKETQIVRVLPKINNEINDSLISDRARYTYDANNINRIIDVSSIKNKVINLGWERFLNEFDKTLPLKNLTFLFEESLDFESLAILRKINVLYPNSITIQSLYSNKNGNFYSNGNNNISNVIDGINGFIFFLGTNPKIENAILNTKIRIKVKNNLIQIYTSGLSFDYNYLNNFINLNTSAVFKGIQGKIISFGEASVLSTNSLILIGNSLKDRISNLQSLKSILITNFPTAAVIFFGVKGNSEALNLFNFKSASYVKNSCNNVKFFIKTEDNIFVRKIFLKNNDKSIWYNTHNSELAKKSDFILPATSHFEKKQTYINLENRSQKTSKVLEISKNCKDLNSILISSFNLTIKMKKTIFTASFEYVEEIARNTKRFTELTFISEPYKSNNLNRLDFDLLEVIKYPLNQKIKDFYTVDTYSQNSKIMQQCSNELQLNSNNFF